MLDPIELVGYAGTALTIAAYAMKSSIRLRVAGIASSVAFLVYGFLMESYPVMIMEMILLPLNLARLIEMQRMVRAVASVQAGARSLDWIVPHARRRRLAAGDVLLRAGETAETINVVLSGLLVDGTGATVGPGCLAGDAMPFAEGARQGRTLTALSPTEVASLQLAELRELYFQNPVFGYRLAQFALGGVGRAAAPAS